MCRKYFQIQKKTFSLNQKWYFETKHCAINTPGAELKEFERRFKFKPHLRYGWFHLKLYQMFQDLSWRLI